MLGAQNLTNEELLTRSFYSDNQDFKELGSRVEKGSYDPEEVVEVQPKYTATLAAQACLYFAQKPLWIKGEESRKHIEYVLNDFSRVFYGRFYVQLIKLRSTDMFELIVHCDDEIIKENVRAKGYAQAQSAANLMIIKMISEGYQVHV
jgi:hypothetical protein